MFSYFAGVLVLALLQQASCEPQKLSACSAKLDDGSIIDLSSLDNAASPRLAPSLDFQYRFNPCSPLSCATYPDVGICQVANFDQTNYDLGEQSSVKVYLDNTNTLVFQYTSNLTLPRVSNLRCVCNPTESFSFFKEDPIRNYLFVFQSPCCCPNGCSSQAGPKKLSACSAQLADGSIIDLSSLDDPKNPRRANTDSYNFTFNPCSPLACGTYPNSGVCQYNPAMMTSFDLGDQASVSFLTNPNNNLVMTLNSKSDFQDRYSQIECVCAANERFTFLAENPQLFYSFRFESPCCCPGGCASKAQPKKLSSCSAQLADGSIIDLSSLDDPSNPRKVQDNSTDNYTFLYNPCSALQCAKFSNVGICQKAPLVTSEYDLGDQKTVDFELNPRNNLVMTLHSTQTTPKRTSSVECICDKVEKFAYLGENPQLFYNFQFSSPCCCPDGCTGGGGNVKKLGPCTAQLNNGSIIDLSSLDRSTSPRESDMGDYKYFFNPCSPIDCNSDSDDAAFCQRSSDGKTEFDLGGQKSSSFKFNENDNFLTIQYKSSYRTSNLLCICAENELFTFVNEYPALNYTFVFYSPCCCAGGCSKSEVPKKIGTCQAQYSDGSIIDLSSVDKIGPLQANGKDYTFAYKPCTPITIPTNCATGSNTAVCQYSDQATFDCGDLDVQYALDTDNTLLMIYQSSSRASKIRCVCDEFLSFNFIQENPLKNYLFELRSSCCCRNGCSGSDFAKELNQLDQKFEP